MCGAVSGSGVLLELANELLADAKTASSARTMLACKD